ncbi:MAG: NAD(+) synthase [Ilumatobacteraceae bacterium]
MIDAATALLTRPNLGLLRVAAISPELVVADVEGNVDRTVAAVRAAAVSGAVVVVAPELGLTGYSAGDIFFLDPLLEACRIGLDRLAAELADLPHVVAVVGLPARAPDTRVYNVAAVVAGGRIHGIVPKQYLPNRHEFYEDRWFTRALDAVLPADIDGIPFGTDLVFPLGGWPGATLGIEICEDLWAVEPPSGTLALAGATIIANPSGSPELLGKAAYRRELVSQQSARCYAAYVYSASGPGESTMDVVFGGHCLIAEDGSVLAETERFRFDTQVITADVDVARLVHDRHDSSSFSAANPPRFRRIEVPLAPTTEPEPTDVRRPLSRTPFVPPPGLERAANCEEIFSIQATGLAKRLRHTGVRSVTIGISGGLDSTLALLVAARAFDVLGLDRSGIVAVTMPGFGTTDRTYRNAVGLMDALGTTTREISIVAAVRQHFADIGHPETQHDVTYENAQARERTQLLMDIANQTGGFVVGTGDLSEAALGWMTFNGDHMSMYHVNAGVPKTLVRYLVTWAADSVFSGPAAAILHDVVATPITPELLPLKDGELEQKTEDTVGPYELHDFFLFHVARNAARPAKVFALARAAFEEEGGYDDATILRWLEVFLRRLFSQQFKRSAMPDGPKVGSVALSPRGDWRMPSDASAALWLAEVHALNTLLGATNV